MTNDAKRTRWWQYPVLGLVLLLLVPVLLLSLLYVATLHVAIWCVWLPRGRNVLLVYSNSPHWQVEIERDILPLIRHHAVILNWSERAQWRWSLASMACRYFGGPRAFNPLAVVFHPLRRAEVFRFWQPFRDAKHGNRVALEQLKEKFLSSLSVEGGDVPTSQRL